MQAGWRDAPLMLQDLVISNLTWGDRGWVLSQFFFCYLCFCPLFSHLLSHFLSEKSMIAFVSVSLIICFLCLKPL